MAGTEPLAKTGNLEARTALVEGKQALQEVSNQIADLQEQLALLLNVPTCTQFDLVEPPPPVDPDPLVEPAVPVLLVVGVGVGTLATVAVVVVLPTWYGVNGLRPLAASFEFPGTVLTEMAGRAVPVE